MSPRGSQKSGTDLLVEQLRALDTERDARAPLVRLSELVGERLAVILVTALTGDHTPRQQDLVA